METFGEKLRRAIENLGLPIDRVAEVTGLSTANIRALQQDDFAALPDDEFVTAGLRSFAQLMDVDTDEVIEDYLRERERWLASAPVVLEVASGPESPAESGEWVVVEPARPHTGRKGKPAVLASVILVLAVVSIVYWARSSSASAVRRPVMVQQTPPVKQAVGVTPEAAGVPARTPEPSLPAPSRPPGSAMRVPASRLSIPEHGVGQGVVQRQLVGRTERFEQGDRVWYWTLIQGGAPGESIDHVWLHEGEEAFRVTLRLGGSRWRTQSYNDLDPGSEGDWAVEARNDAGRVLARQEFRCSGRR